MENETAGDPISGLKWTRKTTEKIAHELGNLGIKVCPKTVGGILKKIGYSLRVNHKKISSGSSPDRDEQFNRIASKRHEFSERRAPIISVDTKKKELVGNFKNPGVAWSKKPVLVNDHDFRSQGLGMAAPYGIYDLQENRGSVFVGTSCDTPEFAVASIAKWWRYDGRKRYPDSDEILILADCGGSNGNRPRAWKYYLQKLCNRLNLKITVCHYPPGASKWNPIEHRLFSEISKNWAGKPLSCYPTIKKLISTTTTSTGLKVKAYIDPKKYLKGIKITDEEMSSLNIVAHDILPKLNYTILPE